MNVQLNPGHAASQINAHYTPNPANGSCEHRGGPGAERGRSGDLATAMGPADMVARERQSAFPAGAYGGAPIGGSARPTAVRRLTISPAACMVGARAPGISNLTGAAYADGTAQASPPARWLWTWQARPHPA